MNHAPLSAAMSTGVGAGASLSFVDSLLAVSADSARDGYGGSDPIDMMATCRLGRVLLAVNDERPPTDKEWDGFMALCRERAGHDARALIETRGHGGPNAKQRKCLVELQREVDVRFAIMSDSLIVRGIVTAVAWLGIPLRAIEPDDFGAAANFLELSHEELDRVMATLPRLRAECQQSAMTR